MNPDCFRLLRCIVSDVTTTKSQLKNDFFLSPGLSAIFHSVLLMKIRSMLHINLQSSCPTLVSLTLPIPCVITSFLNILQTNIDLPENLSIQTLRWVDDETCETILISFDFDGTIRRW